MYKTDYYVIKLLNHKLSIALCIEKKEEFIEQLHGVSWHCSQNSGSSQLHRQKHTKCNKNGNIKIK